MLFALLLASVPIPPAAATSAFSLAKQISDRDGGKLWGVPVCGPILFADRETHAVVANQADREASFAYVSDTAYGVLKVKAGR